MSERITIRRFLTAFAIGSASGLAALVLLSLFSLTPMTKGIMAGFVSGPVFLFVLVVTRPKSVMPHDRP
jgi:hypothetical protein